MQYNFYQKFLSQLFARVATEVSFYRLKDFVVASSSVGRNSSSLQDLWFGPRGAGIIRLTGRLEIQGNQY